MPGERGQVTTEGHPATEGQSQSGAPSLQAGLQQTFLQCQREEPKNVISLQSLPCATEIHTYEERRRGEGGVGLAWLFEGEFISPPTEVARAGVHVA